MINENWILCRKPLSEKTIADNVLKWGTGGINIDGSRIETDDKLGRINNTKDNYNPTSFCMATNERVEYNLSDISGGRFPANFIYCGDDEVIEEFSKAGYLKGDSPNRKPRKGGHRELYVGTTENKIKREVIVDKVFDSGLASRFFFNTKELDKDE